MPTLNLIALPFFYLLGHICDVAYQALSSRLACNIERSGEGLGTRLVYTCHIDLLDLACNFLVCMQDFTCTKCTCNFYFFLQQWLCRTIPFLLILDMIPVHYLMSTDLFPGILYNVIFVCMCIPLCTYTSV